MTLDELREIAEPISRRYEVKRLDAFGSVATGTFSPSSDIDLLVEFKEPTKSPAKRFFGLLHDLEDALNLPVDLLTLNGLKNPYFKQRVLQEKVPLYEG